MEIPTGAYVIRNKKTSAAVTIKDASFSSWSWVIASEQNENELRDQQIWWIELLPGNGDGEEPAYSITNVSSGKALGLRGGNVPFGSGTYVTASPESGAGWQKWKIRKNQRIGNEFQQTITSAHNGCLLDIPDKKIQWCLSQLYTAKRLQQCWEFVVPKVVFPCGWLQIQNSGTGTLLSQTYLSNPPILLDPPSTKLPTNRRESWNIQWTLIYAKNYAPSASFTTGMNTWLIRNRLTKGFLSNTAPKTGITGWESHLLFSTESNILKFGIDIAAYTWKLDLDSDRNWNIISHKNSCLLAQIPQSDGTPGIFADRKVTQNKSWILTSPNEGDPPPYGQ